MTLDFTSLVSAIPVTPVDIIALMAVVMGATLGLYFAWGGAKFIFYKIKEALSPQGK